MKVVIAPIKAIINRTLPPPFIPSLKIKIKPHNATKLQSTYLKIFQIEKNLFIIYFFFLKADLSAIVTLIIFVTGLGEICTLNGLPPEQKMNN